MDQPEFRRLALAEMDAVYRMAVHLCRRGDDAADLVQETYARALAGGATFKLTDVGIRPWLFKILHNVYYSKLGKQQPEPTCWDLASLDWEQLDERLKSAIENLPDGYRIVLLLWAVEGLKYRQIAD